MTEKSLRKHERKVVVRRLRESDFGAIQKIQKEVFPNIPAWTRKQFVSQIRTRSHPFGGASFRACRKAGTKIHRA